MFSELFPSFYKKSPEDLIIQDILVNGSNDDKIRVLNHIAERHGIEAVTPKSFSIPGIAISAVLTTSFLYLLLALVSTGICSNENRSKYCQEFADTKSYFFDYSPVGEK